MMAMMPAPYGPGSPARCSPSTRCSSYTLPALLASSGRGARRQPFFLEESVRTLVETGVLTGTPGAYLLATPLQGMPVPATVQVVLGGALLEEASSETIRMGALLDHSHRVAWLSEVCRLAGHDEEAWPHAHQALDLARQLKPHGDEVVALHQLGVLHAHDAPPRSHRPQPTTSRPSPWPRNSACARSRPTATATFAHCIPRPVSGSRPALSCRRPSALPGDGNDLLAAPTEAALAQVEDK